MWLRTNYAYQKEVREGGVRVGNLVIVTLTKEKWTPYRSLKKRYDMHNFIFIYWSLFNQSPSFFSSTF